MANKITNMEEHEPLHLADDMTASRDGKHVVPQHATQNGLSRPNSNPIRRKPVPSLQETERERKSSGQEKIHPDTVLYLKKDINKSSAAGIGDPIIRHWWLESLCCILMLGMIVAIVTTLYRRQGLPLPDWPYNISINTLISIFIAILKTAMAVVFAECLSQSKWNWFRKMRPLQHLTRYDEASRGPWGSLRLLWTLSGRDFVATIAAAVTILSLAIDPFAQQLIQYHNCKIPTASGHATISRTALYNELGQRTYPAEFEIALELISAISAGLYNPGSTSTAFTCPLGNCTFSEQYKTVGYCSTCRDLTQDLKVTEHNKTDPSDAYGTVNETVLIVNTTLPSGLYASASTDEQYRFSSEFVVSGNYTTQWVQMILGANIPGFGDSGGVENPNNNVNNGPLCAGGWENHTWYCSGPGAAECTIQPCVRTYSGYVQEGELHEQLLHTATITNNVEGQDDQGSVINNLVIADLTCIGSDQKQQLRELGYHFSEDDLWLPYNTTVSYYDGSLVAMQVGEDGESTIHLNKSQLDIVPPHCIYDMGAFVNTGVQQFIQEYFDGVITPLQDSFDGPPQVQKIFNGSYINFQSINTTFSNIAEAMTVHIRQSGVRISNFSTGAQGVMLSEQTCVAVCWPWLAFPAALCVATIVPFLGIIFQRTPRHLHTTGWKSSPLPLVFHGLDVHATGVTDMGGLKIHEMEEKAKDMSVQLGPSGRGWRFTDTLLDSI